jgi:hypothetical protein
MFARKQLMVVAVIIGLTSLGFVLAEDPKTTIPQSDPQLVPPQPTLVQEPAKPVPPLAAQNLNAGEVQILMQVKCITVPTGFSEECGLTLNAATPKTPILITSLTPREVKMLSALLKTAPGKQIQADSVVITTDGRTCHFQTQGPAEDVAVLAETTVNGKTEYKPQTVRLIFFHANFRVTPSIIKETGKIWLETEREITQVNPAGSVKANKVERSDGDQTQTPKIEPGYNEETIRAAIMLTDGETAVLGNTTTSNLDKTKKSEMLWIVTPHLVRGKP